MSRRDEIIEAALGLAKAEGIGALSVRAVASAAGIGPTTLRHHFPSQADLHQTVAVELVSGSLDDLAIADDTREPVQRLYDCLLQFLPPPDQREAALGAWFELYRLALGPEPRTAVRELLESGRQSSARVLRRWLGTLAGQGHVAPEEVEGHAVRALVLIDGLHLNLLIGPAPFDLDAARDSLRWFAERVIT
ncbi:TetR/AcrR family transcriptional regulator [Streptomyces sp. 8L]|uniref:TetR/AcrR family transcriptional regulator n=1 Tax=Streptomyces sp. 8L TaxID=2877242 RepID=UPI001CD4CE76|nr:TetR/AcrR family transcriptional regulator [Streptomyces sp. 8L]MCA1217824.1 TetR/AcrR family transcriptional regulator [Streptomyces sp. 8L]